MKRLGVPNDDPLLRLHGCHDAEPPVNDERRENPSIGMRLRVRNYPRLNLCAKDAR